MRRGLKRLSLLVALLAIVGTMAGRGWFGTPQEAGEVARSARPADIVRARIETEGQAARAIGTDAPKQILFGDLHVHTTFSFDAYSISLPMYQGEGAHPPADACDFARHCAALDFWSINDHAEGLTPKQWQETKSVIEQCNAVSGEETSPDLVSFLGWEWTQIGPTPEEHYGHKNVVLRDTASDAVPMRPISSRETLFPTEFNPYTLPLRLLLITTAPGGERQRYLDFARFLQDRDKLETCPRGVPTRDLPPDCQESAPTPGELFEKLDDWGFPYVVIPHGNSWGFYTPPLSSWDKQLRAHTNPEKHEYLVEVFSGHGNSEEYRNWRALEIDENGELRCPPPSRGYTPECWRAGEIIRERCSRAGESDEECETRAAEARALHVEAGDAGHHVVPGSTVEDWLDAGQCTDCYMPAYNHRPGGSTQYALAISDFSGPGPPKRFRFGLLASSDNHTARPGTGYKEINRREMTDAGLGQLAPPWPPPNPEPRARKIESIPATPYFERFASYFGLGGLVAVHSDGRSREAIWDALERKEVYGTSGGRQLLWFDLLPAGEEPGAVMGASVERTSSPTFEVRAVGAPGQQSGCPPDAIAALGPERIEHLCRGECYRPSDERHRIDRIEVVRIRPQIREGEPLENLIEDPWRVFSCPDDPDGCRVRFTDEEFETVGRDTTYYVRAIQEPTPTVNGAQLRCEDRSDGPCREVRPCFGGPPTAYQDDCLADAGERAWSSPIFLARPPINF
ncbi:MAG: DUF3604 domain-containing protein [Candidatus Binatia bacterium]|nr:DUF3604 domain-containing protein [Candidatus Binatia bacterium]